MKSNEESWYYMANSKLQGFQKIMMIATIPILILMTVGIGNTENISKTGKANITGIDYKYPCALTKFTCTIQQEYLQNTVQAIIVNGEINFEEITEINFAAPVQTSIRVTTPIKGCGLFQENKVWLYEGVFKDEGYGRFSIDFSKFNSKETPVGPIVSNKLDPV